MQPRPASSEPVAIGIIAGDLGAAAAAAGAAAPEWIKVTPRGQAETRDGRSFHFEPEALAARFARDCVDVAVDLDHALALRAPKGERVDAIGYASELQARSDGTFARVRWLDGGAAVLAARTHRYVSPTFHHDASGRATWLHSIALVAAPALSMPALAHAAGGPPETFMKQIAKALGLPETADETACLAALAARTETKPIALALGLPANADAAACLSAAGKAAGGLKPLAKALGLPEAADEAACLSAIGALRSGGNEIIATLQADLTRTGEQLGALRKSVRDKEVKDLLDGALHERRAVPAERESLTALCATDEGLASVRAMLGARAPGLAPSGLDGREAPDGAGEGDPAALAARARKLHDERRAAGQPVDWSTAVALAAQAKA